MMPQVEIEASLGGVALELPRGIDELAVHRGGVELAVHRGLVVSEAHRGLDELAVHRGVIEPEVHRGVDNNTARTLVMESALDMTLTAATDNFAATHASALARKINLAPSALAMTCAPTRPDAGTVPPIGEHDSSPRIVSSPSRGATRALPCLALLALTLGCGTPLAGVRAEPGSLVFTPAAERLELRLVNHGEATVPLSRIRFDTRTPDWGAFAIENREYPREIAAGGAVSLRLRVDRDHFTRGGAARSGSARLLFAAGEAPQIVELRYEQPDLAGDLRRTALRTGLLLALVALGWFSTRRTRFAWTSWLPLIAVVALFPFGPGLCLDAVGRSLSAADVEQCAVGRGGVPLSLMAVGEGWLVYLVALVLAGLARLAERTAVARRLASRDLALAAAFAGPLLAFGTLDPRHLVGEQATALVGSAAIPPAWGIFVQPIAAAVALAVAAAPPSTRLERWAFAAAFVACFLGGGLPAATLTGSSHGVVLFISAVVATAKIAAVVWLVQRLHAAVTGSRARAALNFLERTAMPLAIANLLMTSAYALLR
ncbi:NADH-quinone oxidoreductase subunit H [Nannocystis bainbridge]|uniref:NADH-quinone oxidoreductase subunit H n=1 Tax=Nannocystis bainbridge TaxID=2995303 RepID=A0ABT5E0B2_9BACT|nr:NADH-quinone oxidoreductase subunit H [Nannocystis bainbridge]MDC0719309.1 NADH-quinone oxidoreductase subunit H [Nannocystis bainbridge]